MSDAYTGGCACGAVRYEIAGEPMAMVDCQCRDCQRISGTGHSSYLTFAGRDRIRLQGEATQWAMVGDSGNTKRRSFCPACGAPVYTSFDAMPDVLAVHAASLDDPGRYRPQVATYGIRGHAWDHLGPALQRFERMPFA